MAFKWEEAVGEDGPPIEAPVVERKSPAKGNKTAGDLLLQSNGFGV